jgi:hypothetical protein
LNLGATPIPLQVDADPRFAAGVGGAARYLAESAGLGLEAAAGLQDVVAQACNEAFESLGKGQPHLNVTLRRLADRIEVELSHEGEAVPALGLDTIAGFGAKGGTHVLGVDRVQFETQGKSVVTRLTKYLLQGAPSA